MIRFTCPKCQATMETSDEYAGQTANCTTCAQPLLIPSVQSQPTPPDFSRPSSPGQDVPPPTPLRERPPPPRRPEPRRRRREGYDDYDDDYDDYRPRRPPPGYGPRYRSGNDGQAVASMVCGILGLIFAVAFWPVGIILCLVGLILGFTSINSRSKGMAIAGITLSIIGLVGVVIVVLFVLALFSSIPRRFR